jgi:hypothetical protein
MVTLISNNPKDYHDFIVDTANGLSEYDISGIAVVALTKDGQGITGYWDMNLREKAEAKNHIEYDVIDEMIMVNRDRYFENQSEEEL